MIKIDYPLEKPVIRQEGGREQVKCLIRKRWMLLTPEEWVRQNFLLYLTIVLQYPASLIAVEKQLISGERKKRFDIVIYNQETLPFIVVECKEMEIALSQNAIRQVLRYNQKLNAGYVVITNGNDCAAYKRQGADFIEVDEMPLWGET